MGEAALQSHSTSKKHMQNCKITKSALNNTISGFISNSASPSPKVMPEPVPTLTSYTSSNDVLKAEIFWTLRTVNTHSSFHSNEEISRVFSLMFPDSAIAHKFTCACGVPEFSSDNPIHQSRSSNAVLEGTGDKYNNTSNLISSMSSISLQDTKYVLKEHFDACIIYCEDDEDDAYKFKDHIEKLDLGLGEHPKICLYTEEKVWGPSKLTERAMFVCKHCTLIFVYLSKRSSLDEYAYFFRNEVVMATIKNSRVRPVLSEKDCIIPCGLYNAPRIEFYKQESRSYKENILSLFVMNKPERLRREAKSEESILSTL